jgi:hypothetical protein
MQVITPCWAHSKTLRRKYSMLIQRVLVWIGALALVIFVFVVHQSVSTLKTTVHGHTAALNMPVIAAEVFPGAPQPALSAGAQRRRAQPSRPRTICG